MGSSNDRNRNNGFNLHTNKKILIVDDDASIRKVVRFALEKAEFSVIEAENGEVALTLFSQADFIVLDVMMPKMGGIKTCAKIRESSSIPILFLSSQDDEFDRIQGLEIGGDDYLTKPFSPRELVARVKAIFRRSADRKPEENALERGRLKLDLNAFSAMWNDTSIPLTRSEFEIMERFMGSPERAFRRNELMRGQVVSDRTIDSHIGHLRKKFANVNPNTVIIETVHGVGYRLGSCE